MSVIHIKNVEEFTKEVMQSGKLAVVDFRAERCGPCRMLGPIIEQLGEEHKDIVIAKVNVDENGDLASQYSVFSIPTFVIFKDGQIVGQFSGAMGKEGFEEELRKIQA